jgi:hypothetical protein
VDLSQTATAQMKPLYQTLTILWGDSKHKIQSGGGDPW